MLKFLFAGDFAPCRAYEKIVLSTTKNIFGDLTNDIQGADISFVNLETPLCNESVPIKKSGPNLRASLECIRVLADTGFNVVGLANNHIMDFGEEGLRQTLAVCRKERLSVCGAGNNLHEAQEPLILEKQGIKVGFIAVAEHEFSIAQSNKAGAAPLDIIDNVTQIEKLRGEVDLLFFTIHGGNEYFPYPRPGLRKVCKFYIDRGADAVICHHAHVPGVYEFYKEKPIVYSLGNLIFDHPKPPEGWHHGYAFQLCYDPQSKVLISWEVISYTQSAQQGGVVKMKGSGEKEFLQTLEAYSHTLQNEEKYFKAWDDFCATRSSSYILRMFLPFHFRGLGKLNAILPIEKMVLPGSTLLARKNTLRCESHMEALLNVMEKKC